MIGDTNVEVTNERTRSTMSTSPTFSPQVIGQTEKAMNAILDRLLVGTDLTEPQWVTLTVTANSGPTVNREQLIGRLVGAVKVTEAQAQTLVTELATKGLLQAAGKKGSELELTAGGRQLHDRIRSATTAVTERLWGDLPAEDLATAGRVLTTVLARANAELAHA
jgi:DNA-binding MarR family transcriptional regulator